MREKSSCGRFPAFVTIFVCSAALVHARPSAGSTSERSSDASTGGRPGVALRPSRPNIVFIRTDDQTTSDLYARTPDGVPIMRNVLERLAAHGTTFTNSFVSIALCCPSRAAFLTGQYAHNNHVFDNAPPNGGCGALDAANTLAVWMQNAGYDTVHVGKYLNGYGLGGNGGNGGDGETGPPLNPPTTAVPPGWTEWYTTFTANYFSYAIDENGVLVNHGASERDYNTDVLTEKAVGFIERHATATRPFFLVLDYQAPHNQPVLIPGQPSVPVPAPRHAGTLDRYRPHWPASFDEADISDKPRWLQTHAPWSADSIDAVARLEQLRLESLLAVDEGVGRVLDMLERTGKLEDTVVFYTSDNGFQLGEHRLVGKNYPYEESLRVPLVVRAPGKIAGEERRELVANIDYAPTIVELARATPTITMDGRSLVPLLAGAPVAWRRELLIEDALQVFSGLRGAGYMYTEYDYDHDGTVDDRELYVLERGSRELPSDANELENQQGNPVVATTLLRLQRLLEGLKHLHGTR
jgi:arylsulfatase A-like enzyme